MSKKSDTWMPFYVTDYLGDTMHLTTVQHGAYLLMLLACWKSGGALIDDDSQLATITRMTSAEWKKNAPVLRRFFVQADGNLQHGRVMAELSRAKELSEKRSVIGKKGGRPPKEKQSDNQQETNRFTECKQTETPSPSPSHLSTTDVEDKSASAKRVKPAVDRPEGVSETIWSDFLTVRKAKRAPLTATALNDIMRESDKAGIGLNDALAMCCARGWQGFKAEWVAAKMGTSNAGVASPAGLNAHDNRNRTGRHTGFEKLDYRAGVNEDGSFA